ncbi:MAG: tetratricopeptide repeat protein [Oscillospiraceae bacterium]|jgi:hypothetical protein|nr:tetratricopeptide repeat protein [Oscillospiraceae bacterium]
MGQMKRAIILLAAICLVPALLVACSKPVQPPTAGELLDLGEKYLLDLDYEQAIVQFTKLIEIEPKNARAYTGLAEAYAALGRTDEAIAILERGLEQLPGDAGMQTMLYSLTIPEPEPEPEPELEPEPEPIEEPADSGRVELSEAQMSFLEPLENAVLQMDFDTATGIVRSQDFAELTKNIAQEEVSEPSRAAAVYKEDGEYCWAIAPGAGGGSYAIFCWQGNEDSGTYYQAYYTAGSATPEVYGIVSCQYSNGAGNGEYRHKYAAMSETYDETASIAGGAKVGSSNSRVLSDESNSEYEINTTFENGTAVKSELMFGGTATELPMEEELRQYLGLVYFAPHPDYSEE